MSASRNENGWFFVLSAAYVPSGITFSVQQSDHTRTLHRSQFVTLKRLTPELASIVGNLKKSQRSNEDDPKRHRVCCVVGDRYSEYEMRSPRRRCAAYFQRTAPWF